MIRVAHFDLHAAGLQLANQARQLDLQLHPPDAAWTRPRPQHQPSSRGLDGRRDQPDRDPAHLRQNAGVSTTSSVKSSSLPSSMAKEHTQVWKSFSVA